MGIVDREDGIRFWRELVTGFLRGSKVSLNIRDPKVKAWTGTSIVREISMLGREETRALQELVWK